MAWIRACGNSKSKQRYIYTINANRETQIVTLSVDGEQIYTRSHSLVSIDTSYLYNDDYFAYHWDKSTDILTISTKVVGNLDGVNVPAGYSVSYNYTTTETHTFIFERE